MTTATIIPFAPESSESTEAFERYRRAYRVAQHTVDFAETVKLAGIFIGGVFVVAASIAYQLSRAWHSGFPTASLWLLACGVVAVLASRIWGLIFESQGSVLEMVVDAAVNTSPLLSNAQRSAAMSLRQAAVKPVSIQTKTA
jgi:uncharacterized membrane protein